MTAAALAFNILFLWFKVARPTGLGTTMKKDFFNPYLTLTGGRFTHFLSHVPPQLGAAPFQPPCLCFPPEFSLQTFQGTFSVILGKRGHLPPLVSSPTQHPGQPLGRGKGFLFLVSGTGIFRKTRDLLHWIM